MKSFKCLLLFLLVSKMSLAQVNNRDAFFDYSYDKEKIRLKSIASVTVDFLNNGKPGSKTRCDFNEQGCLTKVICFDSAGKVNSEYKFEFNDHKDVIVRKEHNYELGKNYEERFYKKYENNKLISDSSTFLPLWYEYKYNSDGSLAQTIMHSKLVPGEIILDKYEYNNQKLLIDFSEKHYSINDSVGRLRSHRLIHYDEKGRKIKEEELVDAPGYAMINKGSCNYGYDNSGNLILIKWEKGASRFYKYDQNELITEEKTIVEWEPDMFDPDGFKSVMEDVYTYHFRK